MAHRFLHSKLDEWGYFILTIASGTWYLLYGSKICDTSNPKCQFSLQDSKGSKKKKSGRGGCSAICLQICECKVPAHAGPCGPMQAHALAAEHVLNTTRLAAMKAPFLSWWSLTTFSKWVAFITATSYTGTTEPSVSQQELFPYKIHY